MSVGSSWGMGCGIGGFGAGAAMWMYSQFATAASRESQPYSVFQLTSITDTFPLTGVPVTNATCPFGPASLVFGGMHMTELGTHEPLTTNPAARAADGQLSAFPQLSGHVLPSTCEPPHAAPLVHSLRGYVGVCGQALSIGPSRQG